MTGEREALGAVELASTITELIGHLKQEYRIIIPVVIAACEFVKHEAVTQILERLPEEEQDVN